MPQAYRVIVAGICSLILTVGLTRFAYTPLLPLMQAQAGLSDVAGGWLATLNYAGYMAGALLAASISSLRLKHQLYRAGLVVALASVAGMGLTQDPIVWGVLRFVAGLCAVSGMLLASGLVLIWLMRAGHRPELGVHFSGMGLGIIATGVAVALLKPWLDWSALWIALAVLGLVTFVPAWAWLPAPEPLPVSAAAAPAPPPWRRLVWMMAAYFCAGVGYVVSATYIVAIVERVPALSGHGPWIWVMLGVAATPACFVWDRIARRVGDVPALLLAYGTQAASIVLALAQDAVLPLLAAGLYGGSFIGIVSMTLTWVGRRVPANPAKAMARLTLSYGAAQILAPAISGYLAAATGSYRGALAMAAGATVVGMALLLMVQRRDGR